MQTLKTIAKLSAVIGFWAMTCASGYSADINCLTFTLDKVDVVRRIVAERPTLAPFSYVQFCQTNPGDCRGGAMVFIAMTPHARRLIDRVNSVVNRVITPRYDLTDMWIADTTSGDCEDYALTKRRALIRAGFPASALSLAVGRTRFGEGHAVLVARTTAGDLVLDNRTDAIRPWHRTDLSIVQIASGANPKIWYAVR